MYETLTGCFEPFETIHFMCMFCKQQVIGSLIVCGTGTVLPIISQCERCTGLPPTPLLLIEYYQCTVKPLYAIYDMEGWSMATKQDQRHYRCSRLKVPRVILVPGVYIEVIAIAHF